MCVIVAKPKESKLPTLDKLKECWDRNDDGAGMSYTERGEVHVLRGFMDWDNFKDQFNYLKDSLRDKECVFHFRIGTGGGRTPENTHPFYPDERTNDILNYSTSKFVLYHNGTIKHVDNTKDKSDTRVFTEKYLKDFKVSDIQKSESLINTVADTKLLYHSSKGLMFDKDDFIEQDGLYFSNTLHEPIDYKKSYSRNNNKTVWYDDEVIPLKRLGFNYLSVYIDGEYTLSEDLDDLFIDSMGCLFRRLTESVISYISNEVEIQDDIKDEKIEIKEIFDIMYTDIVEKTIIMS